MRHPARHLSALADAQPIVYWLDDPTAPEPQAALVGSIECDLAVVGGGYSGLWTALLAKERNPALEVVLLEAETCGWAASGRNGGFCSASLTHGFLNGLQRWPEQQATLDRMGEENLDEIEATVERYGIDCDFDRAGELEVATQPWQIADLQERARRLAAAGHEVKLLDQAEVRAEVMSPTYLAGLFAQRTTALVEPARLAWGLRAACLEKGVRIFERTKVDSLDDQRDSLELRSAYGRVRARQVALGTNAFPPLLRRLRHYVVPVYDYALMTEPLSAEQLASVGWSNRQGVADSANQFHYYRLTRGNRILWGGYDAIYHFGNGLRAELDQRPQTFARLAQHFFDTFPQLGGIRFTHAWGGVIDTSTRFTAFFGTAFGGRLAYAVGYTGLGVGATRFGAQVMLDLLAGRETERTRLQMVRKKPLPFPPEPFRYLGIQLTRWSLDRADQRGGIRNAWLRSLDRVGLGFDS